MASNRARVTWALVLKPEVHLSNVSGLETFVCVTYDFVLKPAAMLNI